MKIRKLSLSRETLQNLSEQQSRLAAGGNTEGGLTCPFTGCVACQSVDPQAGCQTAGAECTVEGCSTGPGGCTGSNEDCSQPIDLCHTYNPCPA